MRREVLVVGPILALGLGALTFWQWWSASPPGAGLSPPSPAARSAPSRPAPASLVVAAAGDIMFARRSGAALGRYGPRFPLMRISALLREADLTFANLESPITTGGWPMPGKALTFRAPPAAAAALAAGGIDVVSLANNHLLDYEEPALRETLDLLQKHGIAAAGAGLNLAAARAPAILKRRGIKIAFLAYTELADIFFSYRYPRPFAATERRSGVAPLKRELILEDLAQARKVADLVFVSLHWGIEDSHITTAAQRELAHALIDGGADAIFGHHPHVLQGVEIYRGKPIAYSLANCVFDQKEEANKEGMLLYLEYQEKKLVSLWARPIYMYTDGQPGPAVGEKGKRIRQRLLDLSARLGTQAREDGEKVVFTVGDAHQVGQ